MGVTTEYEQLGLITPQQEAAQHERALDLLLRRLSAWTKLPEERTDWQLETLLDDIGRTALALRRLRGEADLPF